VTTQSNTAVAATLDMASLTLRFDRQVSELTVQL
jgi:hypothetical protein